MCLGTWRFPFGLTGPSPPAPGPTPKKGFYLLRDTSSRCRVALAVLSAARIWPSVSRYLEISFGLTGPSPQAFTSFGNRPAPRGEGNADGAEGIFGKLWARVGYGPAPGPTQKRPCAIHARKVGRSSNTADHYRSDTSPVALRPAVLSAARIWPSVSRYLETSFGLRGPSPQAFTSFGRVGLIARRLRRP